MRRNVGAQLFMQRIENVVTSGMPDVLINASVGKGVAPVIYAELKAIEKLPARETTPLLGADRRLRVAQKNWHKDWNKHDGNSVIVVGVGSRKFFVVDGSKGDFVNDYNINDFRANALVVDSWSWFVELMREMP
jgi:hypothetical protein